MSGVAIALQGVLSLLLIAALAYGVRLEKRLRELRAGQEEFAKAVGELDRAAARAESGLETLRRTTDKADAALADRIDDARALATKLEALTSDAALTVKRLEAGVLDRQAPIPPLLGRVDREATGVGNRRPTPTLADEQRFPTRSLRDHPPQEGRDLPTVAPLTLTVPEPSPTDKLRQVAEMLRGSAPPAKAVGGRR